MSVTCTPTSLEAAAKCFVSLSSLQLKEIQIRLLCAIINGETSMVCTPTVLMANATCFVSLSAQQMDAIMTYLLCQIASTGGGGGGSTQIVTYTVDPPAAPPDPASPAIAYDPTGALPTKGWNISTLAWT
jgi:hypothetical protein